jgi:hypothetical protein
MANISLPERQEWKWYWHFAEMVVNIYGSMKVKINNPMSQVDVPLAKSQTSFFRQGKYEAQ